MFGVSGAALLMIKALGALVLLGWNLAAEDAEEVGGTRSLVLPIGEVKAWMVSKLGALLTVVGVWTGQVVMLPGTWVPPGGLPPPPLETVLRVVRRVVVSCDSSTTTPGLPLVLSP